MKKPLTALALCASILMPAAVHAGAAPASAAARATLPLLNANNMLPACRRAIEVAGARAEALAQTPMEMVSVESVLHRWDRMSAALNDVMGPVYLLSSVHPDKAVRDAGETCITESTSFTTTLYQNRAIFERISVVKTTDPVDMKLRQDALDAFEDSGVALPEAKRIRAKAIFEELESLRQDFSRNIRDNKDTLSFSPDEQAGLPESYLERVNKDDEGNIVVGFDYPDVYPFLQNGSNGEARKRYYKAFQNRGGAENLKILNTIVDLRSELAALYDQNSFADYVTRRRMAGSGSEVRGFLDEAGVVIAEAESKDVAELKALKAEQTGESLNKVQIKQWDRSYYTEKLRQAKANIDQESLRKYFPTTATRDWILDIAQRLYGVRFERAEVPTWHEDVEYYDLYDQASGEHMSGIYLDLYPRDGKYKHAAAWPVRASSTLTGRKPYSVLVCNFDRKGLTQDEVSTFFHEFGHGMHGILSRTRYQSNAGTSVERDFVEAPSQMFEEWGRRPETLALLQQHCPSCEPLSDDLIERLDVAERVGSGLAYARQHLYASFDIRLYDGKPQPALPLWAKLERATPYGHLEGSEFPGTFGHIAGGYAAGYYGYMWSESIALDMLSAFGDELLSPEVGMRLRNSIMSRGSERSARVMVREFLGRAPNSEAFYAAIRGEK